ncbi:MAG: exodeoxyribonuclease VII small subunit [Planctomycetota bacterium]
MSQRAEDGSGGDAVGFEEAIARVEAIVERIESGEAGLEESIAAYEQGAALVKRCRAVLDRAERRIEELTIEEASGEAGGAGEDAGSIEGRGVSGDEDAPF